MFLGDSGLEVVGIRYLFCMIGVRRFGTIIVLTNMY